MMTSESEGPQCELASQECIPCKGGVPPLEGEKLDEMAERLGGEWMVVEEHHLEKEFRFDDFRQALDFTNKVGELAEQIGHHPDILLSWGRCKVTIWTHKIGGLAQADFVFAAKVDALG
jgi:4a-hydroxytetrahydrobiopterin dehydratase